MRLENKIVLITGAGSGIGRAMALLFAEEGARVFAADLDGATARQAAAEITATGGEAHSMGADVSRTEDVQQMVRACVDCFGRIDVLCNIAGIGSTQTVVDTPEEVYDRVMAVNARGTFLCCKYTVPHMIEQGGGVIINMGSVVALVGVVDRAAYSAAKGAIVSMTRAIAIDHVKQNIRCNCLCPGTVHSPWVDRNVNASPDPAAYMAAMVARQPMGRLGTPEEIAKAALYLASDDAAFVTGASLVIDGGMTAQ